jgi:outer membrane protein assembly factor BamD
MKLNRLYQVVLLVLVFVALGACSKFSKLQKSGDVNEKYAGAVDYYNKKDYFRAGTLLDEIIPLMKGTENYERAQLYFAYCKYYNAGAGGRDGFSVALELNIGGRLR